MTITELQSLTAAIDGGLSRNSKPSTANTHPTALRTATTGAHFLIYEWWSEHTKSYWRSIEWSNDGRVHYSKAWDYGEEPMTGSIKLRDEIEAML